MIRNILVDADLEHVIQQKKKAYNNGCKLKQQRTEGNTRPTKDGERRDHRQ